MQPVEWSHVRSNPQASMQTLINSLGEPLRNQANLLTDSNAPVSQYVFDGNQMALLLRDGESSIIGL